MKAKELVLTRKQLKVLKGMGFEPKTETTFVWGKWKRAIKPSWELHYTKDLEGMEDQFKIKPTLTAEELIHHMPASYLGGILNIEIKIDGVWTFYKKTEEGKEKRLCTGTGYNVKDALYATIYTALEELGEENEEEENKKE